MSKETERQEEAEERGETTSMLPENSGADLGPAERINASDLVSEDKDRPIADNKLPPPSPLAESGGTPAEPANPETQKGKRGRKPMTDEEKLRAKQVRDFIKTGAKPDFSKLPSGSIPSAGGIPAAGPQSSTRNYLAEAMSLFIPVSVFAGKSLGPHWGIAIKEETKDGLTQKVIKLTDEQSQYVDSMARWLEYEQFPEMNPRYAFLAQSVMYAAPKIVTEPTPTKIKGGWEWFRVKILRRAPKPLKRSEPVHE